MTFEGALREVLDDLCVEASASQFDALCGHFRLLERWNRRINLTRISDPVDAARRHYGESAFLHRELPAAASFVDVGSGAGFPGLPFAAFRPSSTVTLVESIRKKAAFLREATRDMPNVHVRDCRIGDWAGTAEWALLRAVNPVGVLGDLAGRTARVAVLGTDRPPDGPFTDWESHPTPWSRRRRLWLGASRQDRRPRFT